MLSVRRPIEVVVLNSCVTETKLTPRRSNRSMSRAKSSKERLSRSTLYTNTQSTWPASTASSRRCNAGRSIWEPLKPPSSYCSLTATQPRVCWLAMKASAASRWASSELKAWPNPSSVDFRVYIAQRSCRGSSAMLHLFVQAKKGEAIPARAGHYRGDRAEGIVDLSLILEPIVEYLDRNGLALILAIEYFTHWRQTAVTLRLLRLGLQFPPELAESTEP